ncbi:hypothetical protein BU14_0264s0001, partial [Porphyra umbilicalis]
MSAARVATSAAQELAVKAEGIVVARAHEDFSMWLSSSEDGSYDRESDDSVLEFEKEAMEGAREFIGAELHMAAWMKYFGTEGEEKEGEEGDGEKEEEKEEGDGKEGEKEDDGEEEEEDEDGEEEEESSARSSTHVYTRTAFGMSNTALDCICATSVDRDVDEMGNIFGKDE